jgi:hypothetical protein
MRGRYPRTCVRRRAAGPSQARASINAGLGPCVRTTCSPPIPRPDIASADRWCVDKVTAPTDDAPMQTLGASGGRSCVKRGPRARPAIHGERPGVSALHARRGEARSERVIAIVALRSSRSGDLRCFASRHETASRRGRARRWAVSASGRSSPTKGLWGRLPYGTMKSVLPGLFALAMTASGRPSVRAKACVGRPEKKVDNPTSFG